MLRRLRRRLAECLPFKRRQTPDSAEPVDDAEKTTPMSCQMSGRSRSPQHGLQRRQHQQQQQRTHHRQLLPGQTSPTEQSAGGERKRKPKLIIRKRRRGVDSLSGCSSIGESYFDELFRKFDGLRSLSQYSVYYRENRLQPPPRTAWIPAMRSRSFEYDSESDCSSCLALVEEIQMHRQFRMGKYYRQMPKLRPPSGGRSASRSTCRERSASCA